jgi:multidrug efflux system membrane fusion protein
MNSPYPLAPKPKRPRRWWWLLFVLLVAGGAYYMQHKPATKEVGGKRAQAPVTVATVTRKDVPVYLTGLGTIQAYNTVTVRTQVDGQLIDVRFREGQEVKAGEVLAQVDPRTLQAQYDQAVANKARDAAALANAQLDYKRYENLGTSIAKQVVDTQRSTVKQLHATVLADEAAIQNIKTQLGYTTILSPISGRTGIRQVDKGNVVHPGDTNGIVVVTQVAPISVIFSLPQQNLEAINAEMATHKLQVEALASDNIKVLDTGKLELIDNQIDQTTGTIRLKATLPNAKRLLWPGAFTNVRLLLNTRLQAQTVPTVAVQHGPQGAYVFVLHAETKRVSVQPVTIAMTAGTDSVIEEPLPEGTQVVTDGMAKLQDGSNVTLATPKAESPGESADTKTDSKTEEAPAVHGGDSKRGHKSHAPAKEAGNRE